jgi:hypothetical protein
LVSIPPSTPFRYLTDCHVRAAARAIAAIAVVIPYRAIGSDAVFHSRSNLSSTLMRDRATRLFNFR